MSNALTQMIERRKETAGCPSGQAVNDYVEGICPHCHDKMALTTTGTTPIYVCLRDTTALPVKEAIPCSR